MKGTRIVYDLMGPVFVQTDFPVLAMSYAVNMHI